MQRWIWLLGFITWLITLTPAAAAGFIVVDPADGVIVLPEPGRPFPGPRPPHVLPHPRRPPVFAQLEIRSVQVTARIKDQAASTVIASEFYNPNSRQMEGTFLFPVPKGAQIDKFTMEIDGKPVAAELLDAEKACRLYEDIVRKAKDPALLEYAGRDLFKARIFPIEPHGKKTVTISYSEFLKRDSGLVTFVLPAQPSKYAAKPVQSLSIKVELESARPLKTIYSPSHTVEIRRQGENRATAGYEASAAQAESDFQLIYGTDNDELGLNLMTHRTGSDEGYFLLLASPGFESKKGKVLPKDVIFVLDTSGSMAGAKLEQAKRALLFCVANLNDEDRFEIIRFATETEPLFSKLADSSPERRARAEEFIKGLKPIGGTAIDEALRTALAMRPGTADRPCIIAFLTDGRPTVGPTSETQILSTVTAQGKGKENTRVFCFGIGTDVNTHLLDKIAEQTRAFTQYVLPEEDIEVKVSSFFTKIKEPVLASLKLRFPDSVRVTRQFPSDLPDLYLGEQLVVAGRYSGTGTGTLVLEGQAGRDSKQFTAEVQFPDSDKAHDFIPRLWATRRVGYLLDEIRLRGESAELRQEVAELARQYGIVTPYTAYLILEDETRRGVPLALQSLPELREDRRSQESLRYFNSIANRSRTGDAAVAGSRYGLALKQADNFQALGMSEIEAQRGFTASAPLQVHAGRRLSAAEPATAAPVQTGQQQFVNGRNFFLNGTQWVDASVQSQTNAPRIALQFNSADYFAFVRKHPAAAPWLALGEDVVFSYAGTVYEVTSGTP